MSPPLNFLVIMSDEHRRDAMGCMGHLQVKTPHLDRLAQNGVVFDRAYTPSPMCVPARAAVATGQPPHITGHWDSATPYAGAPQSWMHRLRDAGHHTVSIISDQHRMIMGFLRKFCRCMLLRGSAGQLVCCVRPNLIIAVQRLSWLQMLGWGKAVTLNMTAPLPLQLKAG